MNIIQQSMFLQPKVITTNSAANYEGLPKGFFNVQAASGKKYLGYNGGFLAWGVGAFVVDGGKRIAAPENREELPTVISQLYAHADRSADTSAVQSSSRLTRWTAITLPSFGKAKNRRQASAGTELHPVTGLYFVSFCGSISILNVTLYKRNATRSRRTI